MSLTIEEMNLTPEVEAKARRLKALYPGVRFTSGRRSLVDQARAMAQNCAQDRNYIQNTYINSPTIRKLQYWVDTHPTADTVAEIQAGLHSVMLTLTPRQRNSISRHLTGTAFDVAPGSCPLQALKDLKPLKLLTRESGLVRWHLSW